MARVTGRPLAALLALALVASACSGSDDGKSAAASSDGDHAAKTTVDYEALGLWDDGPCDESRPPLKVGLMTVFESPVLSLGVHATALEAAAEAFNARGGANGACIEVHTCDDKANPDQSLACVRELDDAGVVATINDQTTAGVAEVSAAMSDAGIPRIGTNVVPADWADPNAYPIDAAGIGGAFLFPKGLIDEGAKKIAMIRPDLAEASALIGLLRDLYQHDGVTLPVDLAVAAGTTDYSQYILSAEREGVDGVTLTVAEQEGFQLARAAEQLGSDLLLAASLGSFSHARVTELGDIAKQMVFVWSYPPATIDVPVYEVVRDDLAASGNDELQPDTLAATPMRSWIGLYALLKILRDAGTAEFTREGVTQLLDGAKDVPMLGMFGGENWTPALDHPGAFKRAGMNHWSIYRWDPDADAPGELDGNFVESSSIDFDEVLCGSPFGAPAASCAAG
jgi:ABC-type branched-subunit amino acid transport system substrate-binding protein